MDLRIEKHNIVEQMKKKILILDGAMGTSLQQANLSSEDFGGEAYEGCSEILNLTRPDLIKKIHRDFLDAGADIIETNTFGATSLVLSEYGLQNKTAELNIAAVQLAKDAINDFYSFSNLKEPKFIAGSIGPTTKTLSLTDGISFDQLVEAYYQQASALIKGGVDLLLIETSQDTLNVKAAGIGIKKALAYLEPEIPIMISGTIELNGTTLAGQNIEAFYHSLKHLKPISIGLNCATGPDLMGEHIRSLSDISSFPISCYPNAGLPDEEGHYQLTPKQLAHSMKGFANNNWLNIAGGCCGTNPEHIRELSFALKDISPRIDIKAQNPAISGLEVLEIDEKHRPILVGERTNVIGSRKFKELIISNKFEEASEVARSQIKKGAQVIDVCLSNPDRDEYSDMENFIKFVTKKVKAPIMVDSTDPEVIELSLKHIQGKGIINSTNLEEGEGNLREFVHIAKKYGASLVVGTIDEEGMATTAESKLKIAKRAYDLLVDKYNIPPEDLIFDPLVFPIGTGDKNLHNSAKETLKALKGLKNEFPHSQTILGVSNVSFGLPSAGREVLNAVFLYHATLAGLDFAIVNSEKLQRFASISIEERRLAENLLFYNSKENIELFNLFYREKRTTNILSKPKLSLEERLKHYIIEGSKEGLTEDIDLALRKHSPLEIINGPLMNGMDEVGKLFNKNKLIVAEVLQSAEVMKSAVTQLEGHMDVNDIAKRGKIVLATVKGDVHDIGKNLANIILSNNGYEVIDLGIKVSSEQIIEACKNEMPDIIGLSGLLVKSAQQMTITAKDLAAAEIHTPIIVGGAALTRKFTSTKIAPAYSGEVLYAKDAMDGLRMINEWMKNKQKPYNSKMSQVASENSPIVNSAIQPAQIIHHHSNLSHGHQTYKPKSFERKIILDYPIEKLEANINWQRLLGKHLGLRGDVIQLIKKEDVQAIKLFKLVTEILTKAKKDQLIHANGVFSFFQANSSGNSIYISDQNSTVFTFPRQLKKPYLSVADFIKPFEAGNDYIGMFAVSTGQGISDLARQWRENGEFLRSHALQAIAIELAEALAERVHAIMRDHWGLRSNAGIRLSFGYPSVPSIEDQVKLFQLLKPEEIGIHLTEGFMMEPEASVSALIFSHPEAKYFNV